MSEVDWGQPRPPRPGPLPSENQIATMTRTYFRPEGAIGGTRQYVESGHDSYWTGRPSPVRARRA